MDIGYRVNQWLQADRMPGMTKAITFTDSYKHMECLGEMRLQSFLNNGYFSYPVQRQVTQLVIHIYSGITSGSVLNGELLYTKVLEVNLFAFAYRLFHRDFFPLDGASCILPLTSRIFM